MSRANKLIATLKKEGVPWQAVNLTADRIFHPHGARKEAAIRAAVKRTFPNLTALPCDEKQPHPNVLRFITLKPNNNAGRQTLAEAREWLAQNPLHWKEHFEYVEGLARKKLAKT